ncbi:MAG: metallophosphoesterase family protein [Anaerolineales bacterium]|nr:metallophosphoesterase family protein [Anaerolineales bacterium]
MTQIAVLSDIHGNSVALEAVLTDLENHGRVEAMIILGDLVVFGPDPVGVLALLQKQDHIFHIRGNTDRYLIEKQYPGHPDGQDWQSQVLASFPWTAEQLGPAELQFLTQLPTQQLLSLSQDHTVLAVHGSSRSDEDNIRPNTSDTELATMLNLTPSTSITERDYQLLLCAHTHIPVDRMLYGRRIVNTGSVGLPFDGKQSASYILIHLQPQGNLDIEFRRVAYDVEKTIKQLWDVDHPTANISTINLRTARPLSQDLIYTDNMRKGQRPRIPTNISYHQVEAY